MTHETLPRKAVDDLRAIIDTVRFKKGEWITKPPRNDGKPSGQFLWKRLQNAHAEDRERADSPIMRQEFDHEQSRVAREDAHAYADGGADEVFESAAGATWTLRGVKRELPEPDKVGRFIAKRHKEQEALAKRELYARLEAAARRAKKGRAA